MESQYRKNGQLVAAVKNLSEMAETEFNKEA